MRNIVVTKERLIENGGGIASISGPASSRQLFIADEFSLRIFSLACDPPKVTLDSNDLKLHLLFSGSWNMKSACK